MVFRWRRKALCTSEEKDHQRSSPSDTQTDSPSLRIRSKLGFLSNPSTPRLRPEPVPNDIPTCRFDVVSTPPTTSLPSSPKLNCRTTSNASFSNPSSPRSPSSGLSLLRARLLLNKSCSSRCGICMLSVKSGQDTEIFTAECSHAFHLPCIVKLSDKQCPVCATAWAVAPSSDPSVLNTGGAEPRGRPEVESKIREIKTGKLLRVYNDDEPLANSPMSLSQFNTIPESDENEIVEDDEFPGFFVNTTTMALPSKLANPPTSKNLEVKLQSESAVVAAGRRYKTHAFVMKIKAPPYTAMDAVHRPSVDLVTVLDVSGDVKLQTIKHAMRLIISLLRETDRLSIVVFSSGSKRFLPLKRMTPEGRRNARRIVDALVGASCSGVGMSVNDALKKAVKVIEDRRERNPSASIVVLSDGQDDPAVMKAQLSSKRVPFVVSTSRFSHLEIPVHSVWIAPTGALDHTSFRDALTERIAGLLNPTLRDVRMQLGMVAGSGSSEITSVYSLTGRPEIFESRSVVVGDLFAEEERELLVELKVPVPSSGSHHVMSVQYTIVDPTTRQLIICPTERRLLIPRPQTVRSSSPSIERLRSLHAASRAVAESRRLIEREDFAAAYKLLTAARVTFQPADFGSTDVSLRGLEGELSELNRLSRLKMREAEGKGVEPLTPTSAWRAAEKLAKVAMMRKHMNRVSDLHGLEDARF